VLERVIMLYLALATMATAALLPLPVRMGAAASREALPPSEPPDASHPERGIRAAVVKSESEPCRDCDMARDDPRVDVAGVMESASELTDEAPIDGDEDADWTEDDDYWTDELEDWDSVLAELAPAPLPRGEQLADLAAGLAGRAYSWGGISPATGFDCSGLVYYVHRQFGVTLGRDTTAQYRQGQSVARGDLQPGDIVFFTDTYTSGVSHDGIYLGQGRFVHAVRPGSGVKITAMSDSYWAPRFLGARRVI
jgi:cell wall-associated NlpC family hydrolase